MTTDIVYDALVDRNIRYIYINLLHENIDGAKKYVMDTIYILENMASVSENVKKYALPLLYTVFIDIFLKKYDKAHNKIRDIHYYISSKYQRDNSNTIRNLH